MKYGGYPLQLSLPFADLSSIQEDVPQQSYTLSTEKSSQSILDYKDDTLLFMTMAVTMTGQNEMPIVRAYTGKIPRDIRGLHRLTRAGLADVAPHFYFDDSRILRFWNKPLETERLLSLFAVSIGLDFSMTNEMGRPQKIYASFLNKLWVAWLQSRGLAVIPNVSFPDEWWEDYWLEGWPKNSVIAISSVGVLTHGNPEGWLKAVERIRQELQPIHIIRYGPKIPGENCENCTYFANDNNRSAHGW